MRRLRSERWAIIWLALCACTSTPPLRFGTTSTVQQSGALDGLDSLWNGTKLAVVIAGSGQILRSAADGNLDVVLTHAPSLEARFMDSAHAALRCPFVQSRFALLGPAADPAHVAQAGDARDAFRRMARTGVVFVSRGDSSGTHVRELALWKAAGVEPLGYDWYIETGADQGANVRQADQWQGYTLVDLPTFAKLKDIDLKVLYSQAGDTLLANPYTLYVVKNTPPHNDAAAFAQWAVTAWRAHILTLRLPDGTPAFAARPGSCTPA